MIQPSLFPEPSSLPEGLRYQPDLLTADAEAELLDRVAGLAFKPFEFGAYRGKREVAGFGWRYDYSAHRLGEAPPIPTFLQPLRRTAATFAGEEEALFVQALVTRYADGAGIGWHRDRPSFDTVVGVSLLSPTSLRFRRRDGDGWLRRSLIVEPGSAYVMQGPARHQWEHSIAAGGPLRYSITFRTLKSA